MKKGALSSALPGMLLVYFERTLSANIKKLSQKNRFSTNTGLRLVTIWSKICSQLTGMLLVYFERKLHTECEYHKIESKKVRLQRIQASDWSKFGQKCIAY